ncbi:MAG TPA: AsmA family protein, partial [Acidobacteriota bacterium]|nr:AsmA family protein [Acidobacteriota bacterium]
MRKVAVAIAIIFSLVVIALLVLWLTFEVDDYRGPIQSQLEDRLGRSVKLGPMELGLFPPRFQVRNLVIEDDPGFSNPRPFIEAEQVNLALNLIPLLRGNVEITSLRLDRPVIELIRNEQGVWNFSSLGAKGAIGQEDDEAGNPGGFPIGNLGIEDGQVALTDRQSAGNRAVYRDIDLVLKNLAGENASVDLSIRLPGEGEQRVQLKGTGGPINLERLVATPFEGRLELNQVRLGGLREFLQSQMLAEMDGTLNGQAQISLQLGALVTDGEITVQDARFATTDLGQPIRAQYLVSTDFEKEEITVKKGILGLGGSSALSVDGSVNLQSDPARLGLRLRADGLSLQEFARLAPALGLSLPPATEIKGQLNADVRVLGTTEQPTAEGS